MDNGDVVYAAVFLFASAAVLIAAKVRARQDAREFEERQVSRERYNAWRKMQEACRKAGLPWMEVDKDGKVVTHGR